MSGITVNKAAQGWQPASARPSCSNCTLVRKQESKRAGWGWVAFAFSNAGWLAFANGHGHQLQFIQQIGFSITTAIGLWHWLIVPAVDRHFDRLVKKVTGL